MSDEPKPTTQSIDDAIAKVLLDAMENGVTGIDKNGEVVKLSPPASMVTAAINYIKSKGGGRDPAVYETVAGKLTTRMGKHLKLTGENPDILKTPIAELDERASA